MTTHEHRLAGCRPEPLGSYLKALGVFRLIAEQADATVACRWDRDGFVLTSAFDDQALAHFFLHDYRPTPLLSPWNNSSGFGPEGAGELHAIESSTDSRLEPYRSAIATARALLVDAEQANWTKEQLLTACRASLPDDCIAWIDAAAVLTDGRAVYPPLLGTGGNDGRLEFSRNFHQRVLDVLGVTAGRGHDRAAWLDDALYDVGHGAGLRGRSPGQFDPGAAGGVNSAPTGAADGVLNPWDWVLLLEGSLLLASGSARRLAAGVSGRAAAPFTVDASAGGYASASEAENNRGELWAPLWSRPTGLDELRRLFAEGRADWRQGHARSGLDLAKSAASLGVDRGITAFTRHAFVERFGLATVAVPVGRVVVDQRPEVAPLAELDGWLDRVRRGSNPPAAVASALRQVDRLAFDLAMRGGPQRLLGVLVAVSRLEEAIGRSTSFRARTGIGPVTGLNGARWLAALDSRDTELRLAACLASGRDVTGVDRAGLRRLLQPIAADGSGRLHWTNEPAPVRGFGSQPVLTVLAAAHARRAVELVQERRSTVDAERLGVSTRFAAGLAADLADVADLAAGRLDAERLQQALAACLLLDWSAVSRAPFQASRRLSQVPPGLALLAPFFIPAVGARTVDSEPDWRQRLEGTRLLPEPDWPALLAADRPGAVFDSALRRLRIEGLQPLARGGGDMAAALPAGVGSQLAAALLCRLASRHRAELLERICPDPSIDRPEELSGSSADAPQGDTDA